jgi:hypothetical protein
MVSIKRNFLSPVESVFILGLIAWEIVDIGYLFYAEN